MATQSAFTHTFLSRCAFRCMPLPYRVPPKTCYVFKLYISVVKPTFFYAFFVLFLHCFFRLVSSVAADVNWFVCVDFSTFCRHFCYSPSPLTPFLSLHTHTVSIVHCRTHIYTLIFTYTLICINLQIFSVLSTHLHFLTIWCVRTRHNIVYVYVLVCVCLVKFCVCVCSDYEYFNSHCVGFLESRKYKASPASPLTHTHTCSYVLTYIHTYIHTQISTYTH